MTKVKFGNGYETDLNDEIAKRMIKKGRCEAVKGAKPEPKKEQPKPELKKDES